MLFGLRSGFAATASLLKPEHALTCRQIAAQTNIMMTAGYETTASSLAFSIYLLAKHPQRLLHEVDAFKVHAICGVALVSHNSHQMPAHFCGMCTCTAMQQLSMHAAVEVLFGFSCRL